MAVQIQSLRFKVLLIILVVVFSPIVFVLLSTVTDRLVTENIVEEVAEATAQANGLLSAKDASQLDDPALVGQLDQIAADHSVRLRLLDESGQVRADFDYHLGSGFGAWWRKMGAWAYGPDGVPSLLGFDQSLGELAVRPETLAARAQGRSSGCRFSEDKRLKVCHQVAWIPNLAGVYVQAATSRGVRALYDYRFQIIKLTLSNLAVALLLAWWISRSIVRPVRDLRSQVLSRAQQALPGAGLHWARRDEIGSLAEAFNSLLEALAKRTKANEEFLCDLAHEFKNPVAAVRACADNLESLENLDRMQVQRIAKILSDSSVRLDALVNELLALARAEAGLPGETREPLDIGDLVRGVAQGMGQSGRFADCAIEVRGDSNAAQVLGVTRRLEMAFRNLIDNGASFAGPQGWVHIGIRHASGHVEISVADSGPGIKPEILDRVFERFFTTRGEKLGTGLGLAIAKAVVEAHGGKIRAESQEGQGALFVVTLPLDSPSVVRA